MFSQLSPILWKRPFVEGSMSFGFNKPRLIDLQNYICITRPSWGMMEVGNIDVQCANCLELLNRILAIIESRLQHPFLLNWNRIHSINRMPA